MFVIDVCIIQSSTTDVCHLSTLRYCLIPILIQSSIKFLDTSGCSHDGSAMPCQSTNPTSTSFSRWNPAIPKEPLSKTRIFNKQSHPRSRSTSSQVGTEKYPIHPSLLSDSKLGRSVGVRSSKKRRLHTIRVGSFTTHGFAHDPFWTLGPWKSDTYVHI